MLQVTGFVTSIPQSTLSVMHCVTPTLGRLTGESWHVAGRAEKDNHFLTFDSTTRLHTLQQAGDSGLGCNLNGF